METIYDESLPVLERIKVPMVWERLECGVRVEDMQPARYEDALQLARDQIVTDDPMCKGCRLGTDDEAVQEFVDYLLLCMNDTQSFVAVEEETGRTVGILVGRVNEISGQTKAMSRTRIYRSNTLGKMQRFKSHMHKQVDVFQLYNTEAFYKVQAWCVDCELRNRGIGKALLRTALEQTRLFKMAAVMGIFSSAVSQNIALSMGFQPHLEILYWQWKENEVPVFDNPGAGNCSAVLMVKDIELPTEEKQTFRKDSTKDDDKSCKS